MTAQRTKLLRRTAGTVALVAAGVAFAFPGTAGAAPCASSGPASGAYAVNICVSAPSDGATVSGDTTASATASVTGTNPGVQRVVFYLDDQQLLTDYQSPYTFELPTEQFVDGTRTLSAETLMRDAFVSSRASVSLTFSNGVASPPAAGTDFVPRVGTPAAPGMPFVVGAAGDGASGETSSEDVSDEIFSWDPNLFLYLGDVYEKGSGTEFRNWYGSPTQSWGRLRDITNPVLGDHEDSGPAGAPGYDAYWGTPPRYFSYDAGGWHFIQLNTLGTFDQTMPGTPQYEWLVADLAANSSTCTLVYQHDPVFSVGAQGDHAELLPFWSQFASAGVDVVLTANDHNYQRWLPMNGFGGFDPSGITQFVVGTGGHGIRPFSRTDARLAAGFDTSPAAFGALRLQLNTEGAGYQFVTTDGQVADSGTIGCSGAGADTTPPDAPSDLSASAPSSTQVDLTWTEATDNVGIASYDILRDGAVLTTVEPRASYTDASVAPSTTYAYSVLARDSNGNVSAATAEVLVTTPPRAALFADDFESGTFANWTFSTGLTIDTADVLGGGHAARSTTAGTIAYARKNLATPQTELFLETQFKVRSQGANTFQILRVRTASGLRLAKFFLSSTGKLGYTNEVTATSRTSTVAPARGAWHTLELQVVVSEIDSRIAVWLDGIPVTALTQPEALGTAAIGQIELGNSSAVTADASFDNVFADGSRTLDTTAPSTPTDFAATPLSGLAVRLDWTAATDNVAVTAYDVFRGGQLIASVGSTTYTDTSATPHSTATYTVRARDGSGNQSFASSPATAVTGAIFSTGFETGNLAGWTSAVSMSVQTTDVPTGAYAAEAASNSPSYGYRQLERGVADIWFGARVKVVSQGPSSVNLLQLRTETGAAISTVFVTGTGRLATRNDVTGVTTQSTTVLARGSWYFVQVHAVQNGASGALEVLLDGAGVADLSRTDDLGVVPIRRVLVGDTSGDRVFVLRLDDIFADTVAAPDTSPPSAPTGLVATGPNALRVDLAWSAATDAVGVTGYDVYRGGVLVGSASGTTFTDTTAPPGVPSTYSVRARDAAGNVSPASNAATATPPAELLFSDGFESGDMSLWSLVAGMTAQSDQVVTGAFAARAQTSASSGYAYRKLESVEQQLDLRARFRLDSFTASTTVLKVRVATGMSMASVSVSNSGELALRNDITGDSVESLTQVLPGWHDLQLHVDVGAGLIDVYLDNQRVPELSGPQSLGTAGITRVEIGDRDVETFDLSLDDVAVSGDAARDRIPPSAPSGVTAVAPTGIAVQLAWSAASDVGSGVAGYDVFRDGLLVASVGNVTSHVDLTAAPHSTYVYEVAARDGGGNASPLSAPVSISTGAVFESGFETGDLSEWTSSSGLVVAPEHAGAGSYGALATSTGAAARAFRQLPRGLNDVYARLGFRPVTQGANSVNLLRFRNGTGGAIASVFVTNIGRVGIRNDVSGITTVSTVAIQPGAWNELQARVVVSGAAGQVQVWLNGAPVAALDRTEDFGTTAVQRLEIFDSATGRAFSFAGDQFRADTSFIPEGTPPAPPTNVTVGLASALRAQVSWEASADPSGIASYSLYRDGVLLATQSGTSYVDVDVVPGATHAYSVVARDGNGNESARSAPTGSTVPAAAIADGFELGLGGWVNDGLTLQASHVRTGGFAARGESTGAATWAHRDLAADRGEVDARLSFDVQAAVSVNLLKLRARPSSSGSSGATILTIFRSSTGRLGLRNENTSVSTISNDKIGSGWHTVQVHAIVGDPTGLVEVWLDGRPVVELTGPQALGTRTVGRLQIGENSTGKTYLFDLDDLYLDPSLGG